MRVCDGSEDGSEVGSRAGDGGPGVFGSQPVSFTERREGARIVCAMLLEADVNGGACLMLEAERWDAREKKWVRWR
jgi:hypothetical protein